MRLFDYTRLLAALLIGVFGLLGCEKDDSATEFGYAYIYMPQAIMQSGGVNQNYLVPSGRDSATNNFRVDKANNKVRILLGVSRSGKQATVPFSVNVFADTDTVQHIINEGIWGESAQLLPQQIYSLPSSVHVANNAYATAFYLDIDLDQLVQHSSSILLTRITLSSPTAFELMPDNNTTIVVIDVDALIDRINE